MKNFGIEDNSASKKIKSVLEFMGVSSVMRAIIKSLVAREIKGKRRDGKRK